MPRRVWRANRLLFRMGILAVRVIANVSYLVIVFSALSFFTERRNCACLAMVIPGNRSSVHRFIVDCSLFDPARGANRCQHNLVATLAKLLPLGLFVVLAI